MSTLEIEEFYRDPHKLDPFLVSGEPVQVVSGGEPVAKFLPVRTREIATPQPYMLPDFRARLLALWGPDAFESTLSVEDDFALLREQRIP